MDSESIYTIIDRVFSTLLSTDHSPSVRAGTLNASVAFARISSAQKDNRRDLFDYLIQTLYTERHLYAITKLILQDPPSPNSHEEIALSTRLIIETCCEEEQRQALLVSGALDALASRIAELVIESGCCVDDAINARYYRNHVQPHGTMELLPDILLAICSILWGSSTRGVSFCLSPALDAVFGLTDGTKDSMTPPQPVQCGDVATIEQLQSLLPEVPWPTPRQTTSSSPGRQHSPVKPSADNLPIPETAIVTWLLYIVRSEEGLTRLRASWLLAILMSLGLVHHMREESFVWLLIPHVVQMLDKNTVAREQPLVHGSIHNLLNPKSPQWTIKELAPTVLSVFVLHNTDLQKAAVDAGAIQKLCQNLKESFERSDDSREHYWSPNPKDESQNLAPFVTPEDQHVFEVRYAVFRALSSLASLRDVYRKSIIEQGMIPFAIKSLKSTELANSGSRPSPDPPEYVILAALGLIRALSRSVATLRTSLMDAGLPDPLFELLGHECVDIVVAATAVLCNLVLEFSPMREAIVDKGILDPLCANARSQHAELRLNSVWALKHLVLKSPLDLRKKCLYELGADWLRHIISYTDLPSPSIEFSDGSSPPLLSTANAAHEQVNILNSNIPISRSPLRDRSAHGEDIPMPDRITSSLLAHNAQSSKVPKLSPSSMLVQRRTTLKPDLYSHSSTVADSAIQRQGLDLIRNMITAEGTSDMIEHLLQTLGQQQFFDLIAAKLRPRPFSLYSHSDNHRQPAIGTSNGLSGEPSSHGLKSKTGENTTGDQRLRETEIIISTLYILVHIAASAPRHKSLLTNRASLLNAITPLFDHSSREVRLPCCWIAINLTTLEDGADISQAKTRAREVMAAGWFDKLRAMETGDAELDVRERAMTAVKQITDRSRT